MKGRKGMQTEEIRNLGRKATLIFSSVPCMKWKVEKREQRIRKETRARTGRKGNCVFIREEKTGSEGKTGKQNKT